MCWVFGMLRLVLPVMWVISQIAQLYRFMVGNIYHWVLPIRNSLTTRGHSGSVAITHLVLAPIGFHWNLSYCISINHHVSFSILPPKWMGVEKHSFCIWWVEVERACFEWMWKISISAFGLESSLCAMTIEQAGNLCKKIQVLLWQSEICGNKSQCRIPGCSQVIYLSKAFLPFCLLPQSTSYLSVWILWHKATTSPIGFLTALVSNL